MTTDRSFGTAFLASSRSRSSRTAKRPWRVSGKRHKAWCLAHRRPTLRRTQPGQGNGAPASQRRTPRATVPGVFFTCRRPAETSQVVGKLSGSTPKWREKTYLLQALLAKARNSNKLIDVTDRSRHSAANGARIWRTPAAMYEPRGVPLLRTINDCPTLCD